MCDDTKMAFGTDEDLNYTNLIRMIRKYLTKPCVNNRCAIWYVSVAKISCNPVIHLLPHRQSLPTVQKRRC